jgi:alpha-L-fucosidase
MYLPGNADYISHLKEYGHPSTNGFKDVIHQWKAANFDPGRLLAFYKANGAKYFMALANHHDNFDNFNSKYQPWNSLAIGPKKDLIGGWAKAARKNGLRFAVSVHASRAWSWYEPAQGADKDGPFAGVPYDGRLTRADGRGQWWDGLDPQDLYAQNHAPGAKLEWSWDPAKGSSVPDAAYMKKFFNRTKQLWDDYQPDMIYFDDSVLPFHGVTDEIGLKLAAHFYNSSIQQHAILYSPHMAAHIYNYSIKLHSRNEAVMNAKNLDESQRQALVYDIERGKATGILPRPWQTDTCIGSWHYDRSLFEKHKYKSAASVVPMLADIVSKNGNLMLSVPLQRDGTPDADEIKIVSDIGAWLKINGDAIYATRPWKIYGEGPSTMVAEKGRFGGQTDVQKAPFTAEDIRFTQSKHGRTLYAIVLAFPVDGKITIKSLASNSPNWPGRIGRVRMLGISGKLNFTRDENGLHVALPEKQPCKIAFALKIQS